MRPSEPIRTQRTRHYIYYLVFGLGSAALLIYYLSNTLFHHTTSQQFPVNSFKELPLTLLVFPAELFSILFALYFVYVLFGDRKRKKARYRLRNKKRTPVAVLVPVYHEPEDIVDRTLAACDKLRWPGGVNLYLCDDSSDKESKRQMRELAKRYNATYIDRPDKPLGKKAGNINYAIKHHVKEPFFAILDADQAPTEDFLELTMDHFSDQKVGFVQVPQYFIEERSALERAMKVATNIFYQAMCVTKSNDGALPFCGTNAVIRTSAFREVSGFAYYTATEDIELGLRLNEAGYHGEYVAVNCVYGFAPPDLKAYAVQQYRWANGNLAIFRENFLRILAGKFSLRHQIHTVFTLAWWSIGLVTLLYVLVPILSLFTGLGTHHTWLPSTLLALLYVNVMVGIGMIFVSLNGRLQSDRVTLGDAVMQYVLLTNSFIIYTRALVNALFKRYIGFERTSKKASASGIGLIKWNLLLGAVAFGSSVWALYNAMISPTIELFRTFFPLSLWLLFYSLVLFGSIVFVGKPQDAPTTTPTATTTKSSRGATA
jgi:cellulose synthase/poly-beta-1,6-N-acetylglucosamine synthase-like glycosyltransferase